MAQLLFGSAWRIGTRESDDDGKRTDKDGPWHTTMVNSNLHSHVYAYRTHTCVHMMPGCESSHPAGLNTLLASGPNQASKMPRGQPRTGGTSPFAGVPTAAARPSSKANVDDQLRRVEHLRLAGHAGLANARSPHKTGLRRGLGPSEHQWDTGPMEESRQGLYNPHLRPRDNLVAAGCYLVDEPARSVSRPPAEAEPSTTSRTLCAFALGTEWEAPKPGKRGGEASQTAGRSYWIGV